MKIIFFTQNYWKGGLDTFLISLINNWPNEQDSLEIVCNYDHPGIKTYEALITRKVKVRSLKVPNFASIMNLLRSHA